ncbi:DNA polymerase III subunit alpha [Candidatus Similichlamydia laticola]|uniref:DNA polymerase III subunit alpha n=1 Tax=Candidatus Similichlamydia laticola TaxID=2170265 RepID=A0A369KEP4_9BACT|nr:DNA polymerase III subunit alpha [Candidatus Similichlamydia laticola]RDB31367.1 DNA polymerase III alpha subunit [Candidatus Similichlamydia laticola]
MTSWVPLSLQSQYSILRATSSISQLVKKAVSYELKSIALADQGNLCGSFEFFQHCKDAGLKPILGLEAYLAPQSRLLKQKIFDEQHSYACSFFVQNFTGFRNLSSLVSLSHLEGFYYVPRMDRELIEGKADGLLAMIGAPGSRLAKMILEASCEAQIEELEWWLRVFGPDAVILQIQNLVMGAQEKKADGLFEEGWVEALYEKKIEEQKRINARLYELSKEYGLLLVASNPCYYLEREDWKAHAVLLNIGSGETLFLDGGTRKNPNRSLCHSNEYYFKSPEQMESLFLDYPGALDNTAEIADRCHFSFDTEKKHYPVFFPPGFDPSLLQEEREKACQQYLIDRAHAAISVRYTPDILNRIKQKFVQNDIDHLILSRLEYELDVIISRGLTEYLLIVADFVSWAKKEGIPVGPGRGSGAGSIVCYLLGITNLDPIGFHLLFERFINPERPSYPDIDVDICMHRRGEVIQYMMNRYGADRVAHIITFGHMKAKMAIKDVARVLGISLSQVNLLMRHVPDDLQVTLEEVVANSEVIREKMEQDSWIEELFSIARKLEGSIRNMGIHAAGIIVSGEPLVEIVPLCRPKGAELPVSQLSMYPLEKLGMLKMDFLGLKTLSCIQDAVHNIQKQLGVFIDWEHLPLDDQKTFELLNQGRTCGIFQMESAGMQDLAKKLRLDCFEEIIAVLALYRPGPMQMIPSFIERKHGREKINFDHPDLESILKETYGIVVYQEQVMQIAQKLAGYSLAEGDLLRRAMGKKDRQVMTVQGEKFIKGATALGMSQEQASDIFSKLAKFAEYGFNKSHAAAYGYITYVTAYLKAHYPAYWMASLMTCDRNDLDRITYLIQESKNMGLKIFPPDINQATESFAAQNQGIRFALNGIRGVGEGIVRAICEERRSQGPFQDLFGFVCRLLSAKISKKTIECLVDAGACDSFGHSRQQMRAHLNDLFSCASQKIEEDQRGICSFFDRHFSIPPSQKEITLAEQEEMLLREKALLGIALTGDPLALYKESWDAHGVQRLSDLFRKGEKGLFPVAFILETIKVKSSKSSGKRFGVLGISDGVKRVEVTLWGSVYGRYADLLRENTIYLGALLFEGKQVTCLWLQPFNVAEEDLMSNLMTFIEGEKENLKQPTRSYREKTSQGGRSKQKQVIRILLDTEKMKMSDCIRLGEALRQCSGEHSIEVLCTGHPKKVYLLTLPRSYTARSLEEVKQAIKDFTFGSVLEAGNDQLIS